MIDELARAHLAAKERLQQIIAAAVVSAWRQLQHYNRAQIDQWLTTVLPLTAAANRQAVALTQAYVARAASIPPPDLDVARLLAGIRNGATPEEVWQRPFVTVWSSLKQGMPWEQAVSLGQDRASTLAETDAQLAFTHTLAAIGNATSGRGIMTFDRVADGAACDLCQAASGQTYYSSDLLPIHGNCRCGVAFAGYVDSVRSSPRTFTADTGADGSPIEVAVRDHGELGPVLTWASQNFTGPADLPEPPVVLSASPI